MPKLTQDQNRKSTQMQIPNMVKTQALPQFTASPLRLSAPVGHESAIGGTRQNLESMKVSNSQGSLDQSFMQWQKNTSNV